MRYERGERRERESLEGEIEIIPGISASHLLSAGDLSGSLLFIHKRLPETQSFGPATELWLDENATAADLKVCILLSPLFFYLCIA